MRIILSFARALRTSAHQLGVWYSRRGRVQNWLRCWWLSNPIAVRLFRLREELETDDAVIVRFQDELRLRFPRRMWGDLLGLTGTFEGYLHHAGVDFRPGDVVLDIGAHVGTFTIPLLYRNRGVRVLAFEPDPENSSTLEFNARLNGIGPEALVVEPLAVSREVGEAIFARGSTSTTGALLDVGFFKTAEGAPGFSCVTTTVASVFARHGITHCRLLKVDCEGSEYGIFATLPEEVLARIDHLIVEAHPTREAQPDELREWLNAQGFIVKSVEHGNGCADLFCRRVAAFSPMSSE